MGDVRFKLTATGATEEIFYMKIGRLRQIGKSQGEPTFSFDMGGWRYGYVTILHGRMRIDVVPLLPFTVVFIYASHNACLQRCRQTYKPKKL